MAAAFTGNRQQHGLSGVRALNDLQDQGERDAVRRTLAGLYFWTMKNSRLTRLILIAVYVFPASFLVGQEATPILSSPWLMQIYSAADGINQAEVTELMSRGYVPVGIEIEPDAETALLFRNADTQTAGWTLTNHTDLSRIESDFAEILRRGFLPMDITMHSDVLSVIWIATNLTMSGWRIHATPKTPTALQSALSSFEDQGFTLWGVSDEGDRIWYLFVDWGQANQQGLLTFTTNEGRAIQETMQNSHEAGWTANGLGIHGREYLFAFGR